MAKTNIYFNGKDYSINDSALASAKDSLKNHFSTVMAGSGGLEPITWDGSTEGRVTVDFPDLGTYVKVSDRVVYTSDFTTCSIKSSTNPESATIPNNLIVESNDALTFFIYAIIIYRDNTNIDATGEGDMVLFPEAGTYFAQGNETGYLTALIFEGGSSSSSGTPITFDGTTYQVDTTKLATVTDDFVAHLETLKGGGLEPITWDGVVGDRVSITSPDGDLIVKLSDKVFSRDDLTGATLAFSDTSSLLLGEGSTLMDVNGGIIGPEMAFLSVSDPNVFGAMVPFGITEPGLYFIRSTNGLYITSLTFPSASSGPKFEVGETVTFKESYTMDDIPEEYHPAEGKPNAQHLIINNTKYRAMFGIQNGGILLQVYTDMDESEHTLSYMYVDEITGIIVAPNIGEAYVGAGWYVGGADMPIGLTTTPPSLTIEDQETVEALAAFPFLFSSGGGTTKLTINGTEYLVDSSKLSNTITELQNHLETLSNL